MAEDKETSQAPAATFDGNDPAAEEKAPELTVDGKSAASGLVVRYTTRLGDVQDATVEQAEEGSDGTVRVTLLVNMDGRWQRLVGVPQDTDGGINTWDYAPSEE